MAKAWRDLKAKMPAESRERVELRVQEALRALPLSELRRAVGLTQQELAASMSVGQGSVSKIENATDLYLSTLRRFVEALGGDLRLIASFPNGATFEIDRVEHLSRLPEGEAGQPDNEQAA